MIQKEQIVEQLRTIFDPEIALNIYDLGLIYDISIQEKQGKVLMTLTTAWCPVAQEMPVWVKNAVMKVKGIESCDVEVTFEPAWNQDSMTEAGKLELGFL